MRIKYSDRQPRAARKLLIDVANGILDDYTDRGYVLTVRQLYYQLVSRDLIPNTSRSYKQLVDLLTEARLAGLIDWDHLEDRTRNLHSLSTWSSPASIISIAASGYRRDLWAGQPWYLEVWIEKEALAGVFQSVCDRHRVPLLSCRGYTSLSEMHVAAGRLIAAAKKHRVRILHFGDLDPSGVDMSRDIVDRLRTFGARPDVRRIALEPAQVQEYSPPPNPAKVTDSRYRAYQERYGEDSWELDALDPDVLSGLVDAEIAEVLDVPAWSAVQAREKEERQQLQDLSDRWEEVQEYLSRREMDE